LEEFLMDFVKSLTQKDITSNREPLLEQIAALLSIQPGRVPYYLLSRSKRIEVQRPTSVRIKKASL
jgi:hypothetical protein